jgi:hypothetical protein
MLTIFFNHKISAFLNKFYVCVLYDVRIKHKILPHTALTGLSLYWTVCVLCEVQSEVLCVISISASPQTVKDIQKRFPQFVFTW